jgi:hypothetical protein
MASRTILRAVWFGALGAAAILTAGQSGDAPKPLVRKDLLVFDKIEAAAPIRNIFRPLAAAAPAAGVRPPSRFVAPTTTGPGSEAPPSFALSISYIGSIKSGGQTIALVLRGGQTLSVKEGDEIVPGYKVISLSAEAIVVQGPTGETRTFPRQGDRP